jgi:hypothetical protein
MIFVNLQKWEQKSWKGMNYITSIPAMQKSTMSNHINQDDMKKNNRTRKVDADMTNTTAAFELMLRTCLSEPPLAAATF